MVLLLRLLPGLYKWFKAKSLREDYWLYIVVNAATDPELYIINNPAEKLKPRGEVEIVRFIVPVEEWRRKQQEVWG